MEIPQIVFNAPNTLSDKYSSILRWLYYLNMTLFYVKYGAEDFEFLFVFLSL